MRILIVSRSWPSNEKSGVTMAAATHAELLIESGYKVSILGSSPSVINENLAATNKYYIASSGTGAIYSPAIVDTIALKKIILTENPNLILVEGWQTALTDKVSELSKKLGYPVMVVSHGISLHRFSNTILDFLRAIAWLPYRYNFNKRLSGLSVLTTLDCKSNSLRFYDRMIAEKMNLPLCKLSNTAVNYINNRKIPYAAREREILIVGYFSPIKNQLGIINIIRKLPQDIKASFIGPKNGSYYEKCYKQVFRLNLSERVSFFEDHEVNLPQKLSLARMVVLLSKTEVLPLTLLEAMASGTPFVASSVGAIPSLEGGIVVSNEKEAIKAIIMLDQSKDLWNEMSKKGMAFYKKNYSRDIIKNQLVTSINIAVSSNATQ